MVSLQDKVRRYAERDFCRDVGNQWFLVELAR